MSELMKVDDKKLLAPKDQKELSTFIALLAKGGAFPERFDTQVKRLAVYNASVQLLGADKWALGPNHMAFIKGTLTIYGEFPRTIAERTGQVQEFKVYVIDKDYKEICIDNKNLNEEPWAGVCEVQRKGRSLKKILLYNRRSN